MSLLGLDPTAQATLLKALGIACVPFTAGVVSLVNANKDAETKLKVAEISVQPAVDAAEKKAGEIVAVQGEIIRSDAERLAQQRAEVLARETHGLMAQQDTVIAGMSKQLEQVWSRLNSVEETNTEQRRDMDVMAKENHTLQRTIAAHEDRIVDLQTSDGLKAQQLIRIQTRLASAMTYIATLSRQLIDHGHTPEPPPEDLKKRL